MIEFTGPPRPPTLDPAQTATVPFYDDPDDTYQTHPVKMGTKTVTGRLVSKGKGNGVTVIPEEEVAYLASIHCTLKEIAAFYGVESRNLNRVFKDILTREREITRQRLRKVQLDSALKGDRVMLIWLGKNILGQSDSPTKADINHTVLPWTTPTDSDTDSSTDEQD